MREVQFAEHRGAAGAATKPQVKEVARWKDENTTARVVTASNAHVVYSLKNRSALRVLPRATNKQEANLSYKRHTATVTSAQFVNARSNVVASVSENELLVWFIADDSQIHTYFTFPKSVASFAWIPALNGPPDLLVTVSEGDRKVTGILKASSLILRATNSEQGAVSNPDGSLVASMADVQVLRKDIAVANPLTSAASPIFAFSASDDSIVTASLGNATTPTWQPCDGKVITALSVMPNELLLAASRTAIHVWHVAGEPRPLQRIDLGPRRCLALHCTSTRATAFLATGNPSACEAALFTVKAQVGIDAMSFYALDYNVAPASSCIVPGPNEEQRLHVDTGAVLVVANLVNAPWNPVDVGAAAAPQQAPKAPTPAAPAVVPSRPLVQISAPATGNTEIDGLKSQIEKALGNTVNMLSVSQNMVAKENEKLIQEALRAQAKTLAQLASSHRGRSNGAAATPADNAFDTVLDGMTEPVAAAVVEGVSNAIEEQLRQQLEGALKAVLTRHEKRKQKDQVAELRNSIDPIVADLMDAVNATIVEKQQQYSSKLLHYVSDIAAAGNNAVRDLQAVIVAQQQQIAAFTDSGLLEEVKKLRAEVAQLKSRSGVAPVSDAVQQGTLPPETVLATAQQHLTAGEYMTGLNWILQYDNPALLVQLLAECTEDTRNEMIESESISEGIWGQILSQLASTPKLETLEPSLDWMCDIGAEKPALLKNDQRAVAVGNFVNAWKNESGLSSGVRGKLRQLSMLLRR